MQGDEKRIPDLVVFVNGIPVVVLEFKSAVKEETTIMDAYKQLTIRYRRDIPQLFKYNAFVVIIDGVNNRFGSIFADYEFFYAWRKVEQSDRSTDGINSLYTMIQGLFRKERLLEVIHNFIFLPDTPKGETKIVCRYPQYFAATALYHNILQHSHLNDGDGKGGTYFGATGCGKSFTMLFLARLLMKSRELHSPTILFITDRTDLDNQLSKQVLNARKFIGDDTIRQVESRTQLGELLRGRTSGGVFLTTIQKFSEDISLLSERANIICISDEAHRTQTGIGMKLRVTDDGVQRRQPAQPGLGQQQQHRAQPCKQQQKQEPHVLVGHHVQLQLLQTCHEQAETRRRQKRDKDWGLDRYHIIVHPTPPFA